MHSLNVDPDPYEGLWRNWTFYARIIGFNVTTSKDNGLNEVARISQFNPITNEHDCETTDED